MALTLTIGAVNRTSWLYLPDTGGSVQYDLATRSVGSLRVRIHDVASGLTVPTIGVAVVLADSITGLSVTGELIDIEQTGLSDLDTGQFLDLVCEDRNALPAQVLITATWPAGTTLKAILTDVISLSLTECGTTLDAAQVTGPSLTSTLSVTDTYVDQLLTQLQTLTGYIWRVSSSNTLRMIPPATTSSGLTLNDSNAAVQGKVKRRNTRASGFANRIILQYGSGSRTESQNFTASGAAAPGGIETYQTTYPASLDINDVWPNVLYFNGVPVGVVSWGDNRPTFSAWWDASTHTLKIDQALLGITAGGTVITVGYTAAFPARVSVQDAASIASIGHPVTRLIGPNTSIDNVTSATDAANAELRVRLALGATVCTVMHRAGMAYPGETIALSFTQHAISGTFMVTSVQVTDDVDGALLFTHELILGSEQPETWLDTFTGSTSAGSPSSSSGGGASMTVLSTPFTMGGHDIGAQPAASWARVQASAQFTPATSFTAVVFGEAWARDATVAVSVRLQNVTDATTAATSAAATTTTRHNPVSFTASLVAGKTYELQVMATTVPVGKTSDVFANGWQLKAA